MTEAGRRTLIAFVILGILAVVGIVFLALYGASVPTFFGFFSGAGQVGEAITVPGNIGDGLVETEIAVLAGDTLTVSSSGEVCFSGEDPESCVGPMGMPANDYAWLFPNDARQCRDPLPRDPHAGLYIDLNGRKVFAGERIEIPITEDAIVSFGANDCTGTGPFGNSGEFEVDVFVEVPEEQVGQ